MSDFRGNIDHWLKQSEPDYYLFFLDKKRSEGSAHFVLFLEWKISFYDPEGVDLVIFEKYFLKGFQWSDIFYLYALNVRGSHIITLGASVKDDTTTIDRQTI